MKKIRTEKVKVKTAKGRKLSSTNWLKRQLNDQFVQMAERDGYRSRATYKLVEIDEKFKILKKGQKVIDLGCAPGGWMQYAEQQGCDVTGIDLKEIEPVPNTKFVLGDFTEDEILPQLEDSYDVVMSDMAPAATGHKNTNHLQIMGLVEMAMEFAKENLKPGGAFIAKIFQGGEEKAFLEETRKYFETTKFFKPEASRKGSNEIYIVAIGFKG